ncbi:zinc-dependent alcohol dehydrogenase [Lacisediminihabitans profunda]|uniref:Alcohol dehydrogenase catalytic domain-containing protein n=1 Tax=Lacisediminihabitans profunda TaxID=2594790 RepID=A0A5C8UM67_9MICO|nr:alcohol dehydrogenase catalytic domain-containing protein [Lacisediminihabitans profunda]TXN29423.1 alcohol dehydrogenase catalytic domain-containing protein [Lacisediminihabitans profunda]
MRALVVTSPRRAAVQEFDAPVPGAGQLLVDVERVGICGTDIELFSGEMAYIHQGRTHFPLRLGHEWTGRVAAVGPDTDESWIGARIVGDTMLGCGVCEYCRAGTHWVCPDRSEVGILDGWPGALAEQLVIPARFAHRVPEAVSVTAAALVEPAGNSLRAIDAAALPPGGRLLVLGSGTIGLLAAQFALAKGREVHVAGARPSSLALAATLGVEHTHRTVDLDPGTVGRFDAVIDATSIDSSPALAARLVKPAGRVVLIGLSSTPSLIDTRELALGDITAIGILSASPGLVGAIEYFASGAVNPEPLVSETVGLHEVASRLEGGRGPDAGPGPKVHVDPRK